MVRCLRWHCPPDTGFEIRALAVWGRARYLSVTGAPHNTNFHTWMGKKQFCFSQTAETGNRTPHPVKGSGANHYPRAPARDNLVGIQWVKMMCVWFVKEDINFSLIWTVVTFYTPGDVAQNLSGWQTHIGAVLKKAQPRFYQDMRHCMSGRTERNQLGLWNSGSLHVIKWDWHLGGGGWDHIHDKLIPEIQYQK